MKIQILITFALMAVCSAQLPNMMPNIFFPGTSIVNNCNFNNYISPITSNLTPNGQTFFNSITNSFLQIIKTGNYQQRIINQLEGLKNLSYATAQDKTNLETLAILYFGKSSSTTPSPIPSNFDWCKWQSGTINFITANLKDLQTDVLRIMNPFYQQLESDVSNAYSTSIQNLPSNLTPQDINIFTGQLNNAFRFDTLIDNCAAILGRTTSVLNLCVFKNTIQPCVNSLSAAGKTFYSNTLNLLLQALATAENGIFANMRNAYGFVINDLQNYAPNNASLTQLANLVGYNQVNVTIPVNFDLCVWQESVRNVIVNNNFDAQAIRDTCTLFDVWYYGFKQQGSSLYSTVFTKVTPAFNALPQSDRNIFQGLNGNACNLQSAYESWM